MIILTVKLNNSKKVYSNKTIVPIIYDSIKLLLANPILFVPKLIIAILYGAGILLAVDLFKQLVYFQSFTSEQIINFDLSYFFAAATLLFSLAILTYFIDLFFSGFYPVLVSLAEKKKLSFKEGFILFKPKIGSTLISGVVLWVIITIFSILEAVIIFYFNLSSVGFILSFIMTFIFVFIFYFLYPKVVFENTNLSKTFVDSLYVSLNNKKLVFVLSLIPFCVSIIKFVLAYFANSAFYLNIFWILVILTGVVYSIHAVVNQLAFDKLLNSKK